MCAELVELGAPGVAASLRWCGRKALVQGCGACGEPAAAVLVHAWCDVRVCPHCQRHAARERVELLSAAALRVAGYCVARVDARLVEVREELGQASAMVARHAESARRAEAKARRAEARGDRGAAARWGASVARAEGRQRGAELRVRRARRALHDLRGLELDAHPERSRLTRRDRSDARGGAGASLRWRWRLVTISPGWRPTDEGALTVAGLRARVEDLCARARRLLGESGYGGGLAGWTLRVELSDGGLVHAHVLVFGPFLRSAWAREVCGCFVDVREIDLDARDETDLGARGALRDGVREAVKYAVKLPTPQNALWLLGAPARVLHPALAARWTLATRGVHLLRHGGPMRDSVGAETVAREGAEEHDAREGLVCPCCREVLPGVGWRAVELVAVLAELKRRFGAEALRAQWRVRGRYSRSMPGAEVLRG